MNAKHLELYSVMAEHDGAGFPLSYCLISTAASMDQGKRTKALAAWAKCIHDRYGVNPVFMHVDKDMAEIGCSREVWDAKISLCWWHLRRAVRTRLAKAKLATTPYNIKRACQEFDFIDDGFFPPGTKVDLEDYEGGLPMDIVVEPLATQLTPPAPMKDTVNCLVIKVPATQRTQAHTPISSTSADKENAGPGQKASAGDRIIQGAGFKLRLPAAQPTTTTPGSEEAIDKEVSTDEGNKTGSRRTFCPAEYRETIIDMMEKHYCAHPSIPGYAAPDGGAIRRWAVRQIYDFCVTHGLAEVWAYLWENWYRKGRWELWARSAHDLIPILKTTMILESQ